MCNWQQGKDAEAAEVRAAAGEADLVKILNLPVVKKILPGGSRGKDHAAERRAANGGKSKL